MGASYEETLLGFHHSVSTGYVFLVKSKNHIK